MSAFNGGLMIQVTVDVNFELDLSTCYVPPDLGRIQLDPCMGLGLSPNPPRLALPHSTMSLLYNYIFKYLFYFIYKYFYFNNLDTNISILIILLKILII